MYICMYMHSYGYSNMYEEHVWTALGASKVCFQCDPSLLGSPPLCIKLRLCYESNLAGPIHSLGLVSKGWAYCEKLKLKKFTCTGLAVKDDVA